MNHRVSAKADRRTTDMTVLPGAVTRTVKIVGPAGCQLGRVAHPVELGIQDTSQPQFLTNWTMLIRPSVGIASP